MSVNVIPNFYNEKECQWILNNMIIVSDNQDLKRGHLTMTPYYLNQLANALDLPQDHTVNMDIPIRVTSLEDSEYHKDIILGTEIESKRVAMIYLNTCPDSNIEYKLGKGKVKKIPIEMGKLIIHDGLEHKVNVKDKCTRYILGPIDISGGEHTYTEVGGNDEPFYYVSASNFEGAYELKLTWPSNMALSEKPTLNWVLTEDKSSTEKHGTISEDIKTDYGWSEVKNNNGQGTGGSIYIRLEPGTQYTFSLEYKKELSPEDYPQVTLTSPGRGWTWAHPPSSGTFITPNPNAKGFEVLRDFSTQKPVRMDKTLLLDKPVNKELNMKLFVVLSIIGLLLYNRKVKVYNIALILLLIYVIYNRNNDQRYIGPDLWTLHAVGLTSMDVSRQWSGIEIPDSSTQMTVSDQLPVLTSGMG